jgi:hypothetical protein
VEKHILRDGKRRMGTINIGFCMVCVLVFVDLAPIDVPVVRIESVQ